MPDRFIAINRGNDGFKISEFTLGSASTPARDIELRIAELDGKGVTMTRKDVYKALEAFERLLTSGAIFTNFPKL
jgi:hypothetical protein